MLIRRCRSALTRKSISCAAFCAAILVFATCARPARAQEVALTFDDLPEHGPLPPGVSRTDVAGSILKTLKEAHAPATYGFINASKLDASPGEIEVLKLWRAAGQPLGSHTYTHMSLTANTPEAFEKDIAKNEPVLRSLMGNAGWHWFRYPFLWEGDTLEKRHAIRDYLERNHYRIAQVTLDFEDYAWNAPYARCAAKKDEKAVAWLKESYLATADQYIALDQQLSQLVFGRDIKHVLLLHIGAFDARMLPELLDHLKAKGFKLVTLEEAESDPAYQTDPDAPLKYGGTLLEQLVEARGIPYPSHPEKPMKELAAICRDAAATPH